VRLTVCTWVLALASVGTVSWVAFGLHGGYAGGHGQLVLASTLMAGLVCLGQMLVSRFPNGLQVDCAGVFLVTTCVALPTTYAALSLLMATALTVYVRPSSWRATAPVTIVVAAAGLSALAGAHAGAALAGAQLGAPLTQTHGYGVLAAIVASTLAMIVFELIWTTVQVSLLQGSLRVGVLQAIEDMRESTVPISVSQAPMAAMLVVVFLFWHPLVLMGIAPYLVSWRMTRQQARLAQAELAAGTDSLTGLANRTRFFERAELEIESARRYGHPLAVIMGDLDNFKRVNDTHGHIAGDEVLMGAAGALRGVIEDAVFPVARYGGEEFVVAVPVLEHRDVLELAERARCAVEEALSDWGTSISFGVAYLHPGDRMESLVDRADKALYSAKYAGKNRVHEWRGGPLDGEGPTPIMLAA
jgi:diguanylate cyclase (GGDEF)-like protein